MPTKSGQFRLRSLFYAVTVCATLLFVWVTFIRPYYDGVTFHGEQVALRLTPEYAQQFNSEYSQTTGFEFRSYKVVPLKSPWIVGSIVVAVSFAMLCVLRLLTRHPTGHDRGAESPLA